MVHVTIFLKCEISNNLKKVNALRIEAETVESFELLETYFIAKIKEHFLAIPREYFKQAFPLFEIIKH